MTLLKKLKTHRQDAKSAKKIKGKRMNHKIFNPNFKNLCVRPPRFLLRGRVFAVQDDLFSGGPFVEFVANRR